MTIWDSILVLNPLDKLGVYNAILRGISPIEAYNMYETSLCMQGKNSFPVRVRDGRTGVPQWVLTKLEEAETELKEKNLMPSN